MRWLLFSNKQPWPKHVSRTQHAAIQAINQENITNIFFINHSSVLIQTNHINILTDPIWSNRPSPLSWIGPPRVHESYITKHLDLDCISG